MLKTAKVDDRIRQAAETIYQALIEAELTAMIGAFPQQHTEAPTAIDKSAPSSDRGNRPVSSPGLRGSAPK